MDIKGITENSVIIFYETINCKEAKRQKFNKEYI